MTMLDTATLDLSGVYRAESLTTPAHRPLNQEDRILGALGLLRGPLPRVSPIWLGRYFRHLAGTLVLPFDARCPEDAGTVRPWTTGVTVIELLSPADSTGSDETGLRCRAVRADTTVIEVPLIELELPPDHVNAELIEDYWYWFWNWRFDPGI